MSTNLESAYTKMHISVCALSYICENFQNIKLEKKVSDRHDVLTIDHKSDRVFIRQSLSTIHHSILCSASSMPWQQIKLKSAWKKEAFKCCHMQDCMGTSWGAHVVLGLLKRCWVCVGCTVGCSMVDFLMRIASNNNL